MAVETLVCLHGRGFAPIGFRPTANVARKHLNCRARCVCLSAQRTVDATAEQERALRALRPACKRAACSAFGILQGSRARVVGGDASDRLQSRHPALAARARVLPLDDLDITWTDIMKGNFIMNDVRCN